MRDTFGALDYQGLEILLAVETTLVARFAAVPPVLATLGMWLREIPNTAWVGAATVTNMPVMPVIFSQALRPPPLRILTTRFAVQETSCSAI
ncbi:hypothetical protein [Thermogutta sp.]|uniref:hypothetical protein n=1 Tax=Thermogutta sp. TaxID=1962930 RepID=UPI003C7BF43A